jgi:hypothetical protein
VEQTGRGRVGDEVVEAGVARTACGGPVEGLMHSSPYVVCNLHGLRRLFLRVHR